MCMCVYDALTTKHLFFTKAKDKSSGARQGAHSQIIHGLSSIGTYCVHIAALLNSFFIATKEKMICSKLFPFLQVSFLRMERECLYACVLGTGNGTHVHKVKGKERERQKTREKEEAVRRD